MRPGADGPEGSVTDDGGPEGDRPPQGRPPHVGDDVATPVLTQGAVPAPAAAPTTAGPGAPGIVAVLRSGDPGAIARLLEQAGRVLLLVAIFLVPLVFDRRTMDVFNLTKLTTLWFFGVLAAAALWFSTHLRGERWALPRSSILPWSFVLLGVTAVATLFSPNRILSLIGRHQRYEGLLSIALYVGILVLAVLLFRRRPDGVRGMAVAIGAAGGAVSFYVVVQELGLDPFRWRYGSAGITWPNPVGSLGNSAFSGAYLGIVVPFLVYLVLSARSLPRRAGWSAVTAATLASLWFTRGRAGMIAAVAGALALVLFVSSVSAWKKAVILGAALVALGVGPVVAGVLTDPVGSAREDVFHTGTAEYRTEMWDAAWHMTLDRPILGWGPETFFSQYPRFRTPADALKRGLVIPDKAHNIFLGWSTATGFAGLLAYLLLVGAAVFAVGREAPRQERSRRLLTAAFGAGLVAYLAQGLYLIDVPPLALMGWFSLAGIVVLTGRAPASRNEPPSSGRRFSWSRGGAVAVGALVALFVGFFPVRADHAAWAARRQAREGWSEDISELYEKAIALNPGEAKYRNLLGTFFERNVENPATLLSSETLMERAVSRFEEALVLQPDHLHYMIDAGRANARLGLFRSEHFATANRWLRRAAEIDSLDPKTHELYAGFLSQLATLAKKESVREEFERRARAEEAIVQALRAGQPIR